MVPCVSSALWVVFDGSTGFRQPKRLRRGQREHSPRFMAGLGPAIHVLVADPEKNVDARDIGERSDAALRTAMRGHDGGEVGRRASRALSSDSLCQTAKLSNSQAKSAAVSVGPADGRRVSAVARRVFALEDRGAERRVAPRVFRCTPCGVRVPWAKGTLRPSALRAAVFRLRGRASADRAFPALALGVAIITVANGSREGRSAPGASPGPPEGRACEARFYNRKGDDLLFDNSGPFLPLRRAGP